MLLGSIRLMFGRKSSDGQVLQGLVHRQVDDRVGHRLDEGLRRRRHQVVGDPRRDEDAGHHAPRDGARRPDRVDRGVGGRPEIDRATRRELPGGVGDLASLEGVLERPLEPSSFDAVGAPGLRYEAGARLGDHEVRRPREAIDRSGRLALAEQVRRQDRASPPHEQRVEDHARGGEDDGDDDPRRGRQDHQRQQRQREQDDQHEDRQEGEPPEPVEQERGHALRQRLLGDLSGGHDAGRRGLRRRGAHLAGVDAVDQLARRRRRVERQRPDEPASGPDRAAERGRRHRRLDEALGVGVVQRGAVLDDPLVERGHEQQALLAADADGGHEVAVVPDPRDEHPDLAEPDPALRLDDPADLLPGGVHEPLLLVLDHPRADPARGAEPRVEVQAVHPAVRRDRSAFRRARRAPVSSSRARCRTGAA